MMKMLPKDMKSKTTWDSVQNEFGSTEVIFIAFGKEGQSSLNQEALKTLWEFSEQLERLSTVDKVSNISTSTRINNVNGFLEIEDLQQEKELDDLEKKDEQPGAAPMPTGDGGSGSFATTMKNSASSAKF